MEDSTCLICFSPFEGNQVRYICVRKECDQSICQECLFSLITYSEESNVLPKCPSDKCSGIYTLADIPDIPKEYLQLYESACFKYIMKDQGDTVKRRMQEAKVLANIRDDRLKHLEKEYPKAISLIAKISFKSKLRALDKQKGKIVNAQVNKATRSCLNMVCNGFLDPNFVCMTCESEFCGNCDRKLGPNHECKQEDLDSVNIVNSMVKCPGCKLPVFKNEGCDSITCANCSTNFSYSTGQLGGHGSHNVKLQKTITIGKKEKLSNIFEKQLDTECLGLLLKLEASVPHVKKKEIILTPLGTYFKNGKATTSKMVAAGKHLASKIDEYYNYMAKHRQINAYLIKFEEMALAKKDITSIKNYLSDVINELEA